MGEKSYQINLNFKMPARLTHRPHNRRKMLGWRDNYLKKKNSGKLPGPTATCCGL